MKTFHIDDFKCTLCTNWFCPPFNLPYLLPCTHSICTNCLQKASTQNHIICPEDLQTCSIKQIYVNQNTKRALQRLMKQHKNYNENTQLECIKALSVSFDEITCSKKKQIQNLEALFDQIYLAEIERIRKIHEKVKLQLNRPFRVVEDWKEIVTMYLTSLKNSRNLDSSRKDHMTQLNHYIEEGRKIKLQLNEFFGFNFQDFANFIIKNPLMCYSNNFSLNFDQIRKQQEQKSKTKAKKEKNQKISLADEESNLIYTSPKRMFQEENENTYRKGSNERSNRKNIITNIQNNNIEDSTKKLNELQTQKNGNFKDTHTQPLSMINFASLLNCSQPDISQSLTNRDKNSRNNSLSGSRKFMNDDGEFSLSHFQFQSNANDISNYLNENMKPERQSELYPKQRKRQSLKTMSQLPFQNQAKVEMSKFGSEGEIPQQRQFDPNERPFKKVQKNEAFNKKQRTPYEYLSPQPVIREQQTEQCEQTIHNNEEEEQLQDQNHPIPHMMPNPRFQRHQMRVSPNEQESPMDEMLLGDEIMKNSWALEDQNFLKQWEIKKKPLVSEPEMEVKQRGFYNCEKEKSSYLNKMQVLKAQEAFKATTFRQNNIEVINESLQHVDMNLYLQLFNWQDPKRPIETVKFVRTGITDDQLNILLNYLAKSRVKALVLSGNNLTDISLDAFLHFVEANNRLKSVYLPKNYINILKNKAKINLLREKGINIYI